MNWLFGYGSLLPAGAGDQVRACALVGWQRSWGVAMDNGVDLPGYKHYLAPDGTRPAVYVAFLDVARRSGAQTNGVVMPVDGDELPELDARERNYERVEVTGELDCPVDGRVWTYAGTAEARERAGRGRKEGGLVVARAYRERVRAGFARIDGLERFEATTLAAPPVRELEVVSDAPVASPRAAGG